MPPFQGFPLGARPFPRALPWAIVSRPFGAEKRRRRRPDIECHLSTLHGKVQVRARRAAGLADIADQLALLDMLARMHGPEA